MTADGDGASLWSDRSFLELIAVSVLNSECTKTLYARMGELYGK